MMVGGQVYESTLRKQLGLPVSKAGTGSSELKVTKGTAKLGGYFAAGRRQIRTEQKRRRVLSICKDTTFGNAYPNQLRSG